MRRLSDLSLVTSLLRITVAPVLAVVVGCIMGLDKMVFGVLVLMSTQPVAVAANLVGLTTVAAMISAAFWVGGLRWLER